MIVSSDRKFCFIHIQKTAGSSIVRDLRAQVPDLRKLSGPEMHHFAVQARDKLGPKVYDDYFSFAFVRNPWARLVSWYTMVAADPNARIKFFRHVNAHCRSFAECVRNAPPPIVENGITKGLLINQLDYLTDETGNVIVDFIGRYENLLPDYDTVRERIGLEKRPLAHVRPGSAVSGYKHEHYSLYYTDELRDLVAQHFKRDIHHFGYTFEDRRKPGQSALTIEPPKNPPPPRRRKLVRGVLRRLGLVSPKLDESA